MPFTSVPGSTGALQRIGNAFSTFRRNLSYASLGTEKKGALWHSFTMVCGSVCVLLCGTQITCIYWTCNMCHHCARCCRARDTQNIWFCWLPKYLCKLQTHLPECFHWRHSQSSPYFMRSPLAHLLGRDLGLLVFCTSVVKGKAIFLKVCLKGNELIISNLENCHHEFTAIRSYEVPDVTSNWKRGFDNSDY